MNSGLPGDLRNKAHNEQICFKNINTLLEDKCLPPMRLLRLCDWEEARQNNTRTTTDENGKSCILTKEAAREK